MGPKDTGARSQEKDGFRMHPAMFTHLSLLPLHSHSSPASQKGPLQVPHFYHLGPRPSCLLPGQLQNGHCFPAILFGTKSCFLKHLFLPCLFLLKKQNQRKANQTLKAFLLLWGLPQTLEIDLLPDRCLSCVWLASLEFLGAFLPQTFYSLPFCISSLEIDMFILLKMQWIFLAKIYPEATASQLFLAFLDFLLCSGYKSGTIDAPHFCLMDTTRALLAIRDEDHLNAPTNAWLGLVRHLPGRLVCST